MVKWRVILCRHEIKELHHTDELAFEIHEEYLTVNFVDTIDNNRNQVPLVVAALDQCPLILAFSIHFFRECTHIVDLSGKGHFVD